MAQLATRSSKVGSAMKTQKAAVTMHKICPCAQPPPPSSRLTMVSCASSTLSECVAARNKKALSTSALGQSFWRRSFILRKSQSSSCSLAHPLLCKAEGYSSMALRNPFSIAAAQGASKRAAGSSAEEGPAEAKRAKNPGSSTTGSDLTVLHPNTKAVLSCGAMRERLYHLLKLSSSSYLCPVTPHPCRVLGLKPYTVQYP